MQKFIKIRCVSQQNYQRANIVALFVAVLFIVCLTADYSSAGSTSSRSNAYAKAQAAKRSAGNNSATTYFRQDPYGPNTYAFGYEVNDNRTGNIQFRDERRYVNGSVEGSFGHVRPDGRVTVTHFLADKERGFLHETHTFEPGEQHKWQAHWPTKRPGIHMQRPQDMATGAVVYDKDLHLNVTSGKVPDELAQAVQQQHGIDLNHVDLQEDIVDPALQDIIEGKIPLQQLPGKKDTQIGFETVNSFIPPDFPIVPFQLPPLNETSGAAEQTEQQNKVSAQQAMNAQREQQQQLGQDQQKQQQLQQGQQQRHQLDKYTRAKANNAEKSMSVETLGKTAGAAKLPASPLLSSTNAERMDNVVAALPTPLTANENPIDLRAWYEQMIDDTRNEYLQNLPNLR